MCRYFYLPRVSGRHPKGGGGGGGGGGGITLLYFFKLLILSCYSNNNGIYIALNIITLHYIGSKPV